MLSHQLTTNNNNSNSNSNNIHQSNAPTRRNNIFSSRFRFNVLLSTKNDDSDDMATTATKTTATATAAQNSNTIAELREKSWILLVDDEESIRNAVSRLFQNKGYHHITTCADGKEAIEAALNKKTITSENDENNNNNNNIETRVPDCIVSDIRMPEMDGITLLQRIRNDDLLCKVPVVLLTAKGMTRDRIEGFDSGADAYLSKPFSPEELVAIVDNLIQRQAALSGFGSSEMQNPNVEDLKRDLDEIKNLLLHKGGGGIGNGFVMKTNVFLSSDEKQVLQLLSEGLMNKEIAAATHLSTRRIEQLLTQMYRKTGVKNRTELVRWAVSSGNVE